MTASNHVAPPPATKVPAYCTSGHGIHTPAQWSACAKIGWHEPTTGAAHLGHLVTGTRTSAGVMVLALVLFAGLVLWVIFGRRPAPEAG